MTSIVKKKEPIDSEWKNVTYTIIDLPNIKKKFSERISEITDAFKGVPHTKVIKQVKITNREHMDRVHDSFVENGAEGTMLRHKDSLYEPKRSKNLLKVKNIFDDEVIVDGFDLG